MTQYILLLGTNLGDRLSNLRIAKEKLAFTLGKITLSSGIYVTKAWGNTNQEDFYNQVVVLESELSAQNVLTVLLEIELKMGRVRSILWGPRTIDIDILYASSLIIATPQLSIPHPRLQERRFTLVPLVEILPDFIHPVLKKSNQQLLEECTDMLNVEILK